MATKDLIHSYFDSLMRKGDWKALLAEGMTFSSFAIPVKRLTSMDEYLESTKRFFSMISAVEVKEMLIDGDKACALTRYELRAPGGLAFDCHVAEIFKVQGKEIVALDIYFHSTPFPRLPAAT